MDALKAYEGVEVALGGSEWSALCPGCFTDRERTPLTH